MDQIDKVVVNGKIRTLDAEGRVASALAVSAGNVVAVGGDDEIKALASAQTEVVDVGGRTVLPSFVDSHTHLRRASIVLAQYIDFLEMRPSSMAQVLEAVGARAKVAAAGSWVQGDSLEPRRLDEARFPTRWELDSVAPDHPVVVRGIGRHVAAANSLALRLAGIDADTPDPAGGRLERDERGELTGVLHEHGKLRLDATRADTVIPIPTESERVHAMSAAMGILHSQGIGCIHEMAREPNDVSDYLRLQELGSLTTRVRFYIRGLQAQTKLDQVLGLGLRSEFGNDWLRLGGVKFSIDGGESSHNAARYEEYPGEPGNTGLLRIQPDELTEAVIAAQRGGLQVAVHAIGQRAVDIALDAYDAAAKDEPGSPLRHRLEHAYLPLRPGQLERMAGLGLIWSTQPSFMHSGGEGWAESFGDQACQNVLPLRTASELGMQIQLNSDYPCSPLNPFIGIGVAVSRRTEQGTVYGADEAISVDAALRLMTNAGSRSTSLEGRQGRLEAGSFADLIVTDQDPYEVSPDQIVDTKVLLTMVGGQMPHHREI